MARRSDRARKSSESIGNDQAEVQRLPGKTKLRQASRRRVAALMRSLHGAVGSDGVASKTLLTSHG